MAAVHAGPRAQECRVCSACPLLPTALTQVEIIRSFTAKQPDELSLQVADVVLIYQRVSDGEWSGSWPSACCGLRSRTRTRMPRPCLRSHVLPSVSKVNFVSSLFLSLFLLQDATCCAGLLREIPGTWTHLKLLSRQPPGMPFSHLHLSLSLCFCFE